MSTNDNTQNKALFESQNEAILSECDWLRGLEIKHRQTIEINDEEKGDPNVVIHYLNYIKKNYGLHIAKGTDPNFFKPVQKGDTSFETLLSYMYGNNILNKAIERMYHYLVLLNRKSIHYVFDTLTREYDFNLNDIYHCNGIHAMQFNSINEVPENIIKRCNVGYEKYQMKTRQFLRRMASYNRQYFAKQSQIENISQNDDDSVEKKQQRIQSIQSELKGLERKIEQLSFEIEEELYVTPRSDAPTPGEIVHFISDFICYGVKVERNIIDNPDNYDIHIINDVPYTKDTNIIRYLNDDDLYFQDITNHVWLPAKDVLTHYVSVLAPTLRLSQTNYSDIYNILINDIRSKHMVSVMAFRPHTIFYKNGMTLIDYNNDGSLKYEFKHINTLSHRALMFTYATKLRMNMIYDPDANITFKDNPEKEPVTPDYIFGALGRRGFEVTEDTDEDAKDELDQEAKARANLLMQYTLNILLPYNEVPALADGYFLYFYNSAQSGKSTFMELMNHIVGDPLTSNLNAKDLGSQESFGLVNTKGKRLVLVDEATNGKDKIDTENIKKMTTKSNIDANSKNKDYVRFRFENELILASNYEPTFLDESGGTQRRLLAFQLKTSYLEDGGSGIKPLPFIQDDLITRNDFKSACITWVLNHVNVYQDIPKSIKEDANQLISKEDDVKDFIENRVRKTIDEPIFIYPNHLYELYKIESISKGRNIAKIRNKQNFIKALDKMNKGVYSLRDVTHSKLDVLNKLITLEGHLFLDIHTAQSNSSLDNTLVKHFMDVMTSREEQIKKMFDSISSVKNKSMRLSDVTSGKKIAYFILPDAPQYDGQIKESELRTIAVNQKNKLLNYTFGDDERLNRIESGQHSKLPIPINPNLSKKFYSYTISDITQDKIMFDEFIKYDK